MENEVLLKLAREACARIDNGPPCIGHPCDSCLRSAREMLKVMTAVDADRLKARIKALESMLLEVLEIAARNEGGEYIERAKDLLFDA